MRKLTAAAAVALLLAACGAKTFTKPPTDGAVIGMARRDFQDDGRRTWDKKAARPLSTIVWYPAADDAKMAEVAFPADDPVFIGGWAASDATIAPGDRLPLVTLSHGDGGSALQMMWLGRRLAAKGYIVAAVDHHGDTAAEPNLDVRGFLMPWERARDISAMIDQLIADPTFGPRIDAGRIVGAGFSRGGYAMAALAGGETSLARFQKFCASSARDATCEPQPEFQDSQAAFDDMLQNDAAVRIALADHAGSFADPRIRSFALLAPALTQALTDESLLKISAPMLIIAGDKDAKAPIAANARRLADKVSAARLELIAGAGHNVFLDQCVPKKQRTVRACRDTSGADRMAIHEETAALVASHFEASLAAKSPATAALTLR